MTLLIPLFYLTIVLISSCGVFFKTFEVFSRIEEHLTRIHREEKIILSCAQIKATLANLEATHKILLKHNTAQAGVLAQVRLEILQRWIPLDKSAYCESPHLKGIIATIRRENIRDWPQEWPNWVRTLKLQSGAHRDEL